MILVGISGKKGRGKDEIAKVMNEEGGYKIYHYADDLKQAVCEKFDLDLKWYDTTENKERPILSMPINCKDKMAQWVYNYLEIEYYWTFRSLIIFYGNMMRATDDLYWHKKMMDKINKDKPEKAVIADVRFGQEAEGIRGVGGYLIRVTRGHDKTPYKKDLQDDSETQLDNYEHFNFSIQNDGTLEELRDTVKGIIGVRNETA